MPKLVARRQIPPIAGPYKPRPRRRRLLTPQNVIGFVIGSLAVHVAMLFSAGIVGMLASFVAAILCSASVSCAIEWRRDVARRRMQVGAPARLRRGGVRR